jgi:hypothetical protein
MATPRKFYPQCRAILQAVLDGFGPTARDTEPLIVPCLPKSAKIHRNSYKQADSWSLTFEAGDLPFDPALLRAGAVEIYLFQVDDASQRQAVVSRKDPLADPDLAGTRPRSSTDTIGLEQGLESSRDRFTFGNKPQIAGLFDSGDIELSDDGKWVEISGQDYTAHLSALQWPPTERGLARRIPVGQRIDLLLRDVIAEADPLGRLRLDVRGIAEADLPIVGKDEVRSNKRGIPVEQDTSYWDVIYKVATRHGLIAFVDGLDVVLSRPKTITDRDQTAIRRLAWGHNLTSLRMSRELGKEQSPTIIVKGYDPVARKAVTVTFPEGTVRDNVQTIAKGGKAGGFKSNVKQTTKKLKSGKVKTTIRERDEYQIVPAYGISDRTVLRNMAENLYHLLGKAERKVVARTRDLRDMRASDMLNLTAGDAVTIEWDEFNREVMADPRISEDEKVARLVSKGFNRAIAVQVARAYERLEALKRPLRVREVTYDFDTDDGVAIEMLLIDFVVVDGIRSDTGATSTPRTDRRQERIGRFGTVVGWSKEQEQQQIRRFTR